ncbi:MAG: hypothetical protein HQL21_05570 [Candidatus Omnitrophica bacterium]|nr:hypothetical protein [Candidatus Omnitrophota bacterium]
MSLFGAALIFFFSVGVSWADVIINVLAVNGKDVVIEKDVEFSLPGEVKPEDVLDPAGLTLSYNVKESGYYLHGLVSLKGKETKTFRVRVRDIWRVREEDISKIKEEIEEGFKEMGSERNLENGKALRQKLLTQVNDVLSEQSMADGTIDQRIDAYRNRIQILSDVRNKTKLIDFWRSDASDEETRKPISYLVEVSNPSEKMRKAKQQHYLPSEVRAEYIIDRQGYEARFDEKKNQVFLFKEEDIAAKDKKLVRFLIKDVWFLPKKEMGFVRDRAQFINNSLKSSSYAETAKALWGEIINNLDLIDMQQASPESDIRMHIGAYRINEKRFEIAMKDLDALEKLLSRQREEMEKSRLKNVMQKIGAMKSMARVSQAMFDKKPRINTAWKIIGMVMIFLALLTIIYFLTAHIRSGREKKQEELKLSQDKI